MSGKQLYSPSEMIACRANADLSGAGGRYRFVKYDGTASSVDGIPNVIRAAAATDPVVGVLTDKPKSGETASIQTGGIGKVEAGATMSTVGTIISCDSVGRAIAAVSTARALGETMEAAVSGDIITVRLYPSHGIIA